MPGYYVYWTDRNQFGGGVMPLVKDTVRQNQFLFPGIVNLETIAVFILAQWHSYFICFL
jgi:hypothetical protein